MKQKISTDRAILRVDLEHSKLPAWDMFAMCEGAAKDELTQYAKAKGVDIDPLKIMLDWRREQKPACFILRCWSVIDVADLRVSPTLIKAARELLGWTQGDLVKKSRVGYSTVADYERGGRQHTWASSIDKMVKALEKGGVKFGDKGVSL